MITSDTETDCHRYGVVSGSAQRRIGFFLADTFGMLPFISALEPLRAANRYSGQSLYSWVFLGSGKPTVMANNAMHIPVDGSIHDTIALDWLIVCGPHDPHRFDDARVLRSLRRYAARGTLIGSLDTGSYLLAQADLIKHRQCTTHWENLLSLKEAFPRLSVSSELYELDDGLFTCAGGTASLDMMLALIRRDHGQVLSDQVADLFISTHLRQASDPQRRSVVERSGVYHPRVINCIELMESNLEQPLATGELSAMVGLSVRQLERLFKSHLETTPTAYYQALRLQAGRELLLQTTLSVIAVASAVGFASSDYFARRYRARFGCSPSDERKRGNKGQTV